jgi:hypothetical protein
MEERSESAEAAACAKCRMATSSSVPQRCSAGCFDTSIMPAVNEEEEENAWWWRRWRRRRKKFLRNMQEEVMRGMSYLMDGRQRAQRVNIYVYIYIYIFT